ncbi:MAG: zinc transporter ZntB [Devosia sp.]|nr:zinc transporter ZntB [Devosia sp.]
MVVRKQPNPPATAEVTTRADAVPGVMDWAATAPGTVYAFDGKGGYRPGLLGPTADRGRGFELLLLPHDSATCTPWLTETFGQVIAEALLEREARPHCTLYEDGALISMITRAIADKLQAGNQQFAQFWLEKGRVIAVTDMSIEELVGTVSGKTVRAPTSPVSLVSRVALRFADRLEPLLDALNEKTDDLEEEVLGKHNDRTRVRLNAARRAAILLRRTLLPMRDALTTLETAEFAWVSVRDRSRMREVVGWTSRLAAEINSFGERAALVQEQITDRRAEQLNRSLLILAAVTTIFMPLTLITGILGMNVAGIPYADSRWAFPIVVGALVLVGGLQFLWFRSRKWL